MAVWLAFLALLALLVLGLAEAGLRFRRSQVAARAPDYEVTDPRFVRDPLLRYRNTPGYQFFSEGPTGARLTYTNNSLGLRGAEVAREKPAGTLRVVVVGGSTVYGALVDDAETLPAHLEDVLRQRLPPGQRVEVLNAGVPGYYALGEALFTAVEVRTFQADVVLVMDGLNDVFYGVNLDWPSQIAEDQLRVIRDGRFPEVSAVIDSSMFPRGLVEHQSRMVLRTGMQLLTWRMGWSSIIEFAQSSDRVVDLHAAMLRLLTRYAAREGAATVAALQPLLATSAKQLTPEEQHGVERESYWASNRWAHAARAMYPGMAATARREVEKEGGQFVSLLDAFDAESASTYAEDAVHYTPRGNRVLAEKLAPLVLAQLERKAPARTN